MMIVLPIAVLTAIGLALLWPTDSPVGSRSYYATGSTPATVEVTSADAAACSADAPETAAPGAGMQVCAEVTEGIGAGSTVSILVPAQFVEAIDEGTTISAVRHDAGDGGEAQFVFVDVDRSSPMIWLVLLYLLLVLAVARWRGLGAVLGLTASVGTLVVWVIPALMLGHPPLLVTLVGVSAMLFFSVYLAHGVSIRTTTALLGTFLGVALAIVLALWQVKATSLTTGGQEADQMIGTLLPGVSLQALLVCGIVIAGLGALNDVTITQASAVWELHAANPEMSRVTLFRRAMRIGSDHIASTVYTLAFAYAGTALTTLIVMMTLDRSPLALVTSSEISTEIVRTIVASIGLIAAIPLTTLIAAVLVVPRDSGERAQAAEAKREKRRTHAVRSAFDGDGLDADFGER